MSSPELLHPGPYSLGEGVLWDPRLQRLYWIDINLRRFHFADPGSPPVETELTGMPGTLLLTSSSHQIALATDAGLILYNLTSREHSILLSYPETSDTRFNDGKVDPWGNIWVGTMSRSASPGDGTLYRIGPDLACIPVLPSLTIPNGSCWSSDQSTFYFIDSATRAIHSYDVGNDAATLHNRKVVVSIPDGWGYPDGMTIDAEDRLWVAHWDGGCVACYDPGTGKALERIDLPTPKVTSCSFGGEELDTLYITTALGSEDGGWTDQETYPQAGGLFAIKPGTTGKSPNYFEFPS